MSGALLFVCGLSLAAAEPQNPLTTGSDAAKNEPHWSTEHVAIGGPALNREWFAKRRAVVYLVPDGGDIPDLRRAAAAIMQDRWMEGDWSLKHVIVSDVGKVRFAIRQRAAVHDIALRVTEEAGQGPEFVAENEEFIRQHVFFVRDPNRTVWQELLGESAHSGNPRIVLLDYGGRVVRTIDPTPSDASTADASEILGSSAATYASEVRRLLPARPELGG